MVFFSLTSPRIIRLEKKPLDGLGLEVSGGYRVGIYITELQESSVCKDAGLQIGDRLLKVRNCFVSYVRLSFLCVCRWKSGEAYILHNKTKIREKGSSETQPMFPVELEGAVDHNYAELITIGCTARDVPRWPPITVTYLTLEDSHLN